MKKSIEVHFNRSNIFLLYFYNAYDVICEKKNSAEVRLIPAKQMPFYEFHHFMKKEQTQLKTKQLKENIFKSVVIYGLAYTVYRKRHNKITHQQKIQIKILIAMLDFLSRIRYLSNLKPSIF